MNEEKLTGFLVAVACLTLSVTLVFAEDLTRSFNIVPPDYAESLHYSRQQPAFQITAPKGWYMALATSDHVADRAVFFKSDPKKILSEGHIQTPNIRISFAPNPQELPASFMTSDYASQIRSAGGSLLSEPQDIRAGDKPGSHFTSLDPHSNIVMDIYVFKEGGMYICAMALCSYAEFEKIKPMIKESVDSITF